VLLEGIYARGGVAKSVTDAAWLRALLDVESGLARAMAGLGEIPDDAAQQIVQACADPGTFDLTALADETARNATPVVGLVRALKEAVPESAREHVHRGATSQDIVDTALMLIVGRALDPLLGDLDGTTEAAARLADEHRATPMIARTLLQQALPTTFGLHAAGWLDGLEQARGHLIHVRDAELAVQCGGPVGGRDPAVAQAMAADLGLAEPTMPWGTIRVRTALSASVLGTVAGVLGKIARDVTLLAQSEVAEVAEGRAGGSSAMAHKRNPVAAVSALACAKRTPGLVATMLAAMEQEHERAAGAWQAEWGTVADLLTLTGSAAAWTRDLLENLQIDTGRMASNLGRSPTGDQPPPDGVDQLIDRALAAHQARRIATT
jgi:3-carboxy-cis,cis-muconate cycloisomerase